MNVQHDREAPRTLAEARDDVERSRARISRTLDRLENRIVDKKHELQDRADVLRPLKQQVRLRPLAAVAIGFGVGVMLGRLGGGDRRAATRRHRDRSREWLGGERHSARDWPEYRGRRLRKRVDESQRDDEWRDHNRASWLSGVKSQLGGAVTTALTAAITTGVRDLLHDRSRSSRITDD